MIMVMHKRAATYLIAGIILLVPSLALAQFPGQLVPCSGPGDCNACALVTLGQNVLNLLVALSAFVAVLAFTYAGFLMVTAAGNEAQVTKAKGTFSAVAIGFIIVLAAWLIINLLLLVFTGKGVGSWTGELCGGGTGSVALEETSELSPPEETETVPPDEVETIPPEETPTANMPPPGTTEDHEIEEDEYSHEEALAMLDAADIELYSSGNCSDKSNSSCTSGDGVKKETIHELVRLKGQCQAAHADCNVLGTGLAEEGHAKGDCSHANGCKFDADKGTSGSFDQFMENTYGGSDREEFVVAVDGIVRDAYRFEYTPDTPPPGYSWVPTRSEPLRVTVIDEGSHWDVQVVPIDSTE